MGLKSLWRHHPDRVYPVVTNALDFIKHMEQILAAQSRAGTPDKPEDVDKTD